MGDTHSTVSGGGEGEIHVCKKWSKEAMEEWAGGHCYHELYMSVLYTHVYMSIPSNAQAYLIFLYWSDSGQSSHVCINGLHLAI